MDTTDYQAKFFAYDLAREGGRDVGRLRQSLLNAAVDLNPHQVEAALFALRSPLSKGVLLADEVGLGKTIEAGLVLCQLWAERKRHLLVVCPASLRRQWQGELTEKFNLPAEILDSRRCRQLAKAGTLHPFALESVLIASYPFAAKMKDALKVVPWDRVVIDEAHKLRNAYRESNVTGQALRWALADRKKLLLTATPMQNGLTELYGVSTLIDDSLFGDLPSFRSRYANAGGDLDGLRERLKTFCQRTLRKDVAPYIRYTNRLPMTEAFDATAQELSLYDDVSRYLQDETAYAFPPAQRPMLTLLVRKLLSSSPCALAGTLRKVLDRLEALRDSPGTAEPDRLLDEIAADEEDLVDEVAENAEDDDEDAPPPDATAPGAAPLDPEMLETEIERVRDFIARAESLGTDTKTRHLLTVLAAGWEKLSALGAARKAVVFTESRRSMAFLREFLEANGYAGQVVCFSGGGCRDPEGEKIYAAYRAAHPEDDGGKAVMFRHALVEHFRTSATILIATEAGAEGINLQFCSMVVNYDLPWNPQRVEQRIGRCHRYGQKHDVVVVNFLNRRNAADVRVFELLNTKFSLFSGIFGASNEILGTVDAAGISIESRIHAILQQCRTDAEIKAAFDRLQTDLADQIQARQERTRKAVLENFDDAVRRHLRGVADGAKGALEGWSARFLRLAARTLRDRAEFAPDGTSFALCDPPAAGIAAGRYAFNPPPDAAGIVRFRPNTPLGAWAVATARALPVPPGEVVFRISDYPGKITVIENMKGTSGWLLVRRLRLESLDAEDFLLVSAITDKGKAVEHEVSDQFFDLPGTARPCDPPPAALADKLRENSDQFARATADKFGAENNVFFKEETVKLERWSADKVAVEERALESLKAKELEIERAIRQAETADAQVPLQKQYDANRKAIRRARSRIFEVEDETTDKRRVLMADLQRRLVPTTRSETLFTIRWSIA